MNKLFLLAGLFLSSNLVGQSISSYVITSAGDAIMSDEGALYLSIGEPMNTELTGGEVMISQGFLQVTIADRILNSEELLEESVTVYPNPVAEELRFDLEDAYEQYSLRVYNTSGQIIHTTESLSSSRLNVKDYSVGTYFLTLHKDNKSSRAVQFIKL